MADQRSYSETSPTTESCGSKNSWITELNEMVDNYDNYKPMRRKIVKNRQLKNHITREGSGETVPEQEKDDTYISFIKNKMRYKTWRTNEEINRLQNL